MPLTLTVLVASLFVAFVSLFCLGFLYVSDARLKVWLPRLMAVAVGVLLGDAFLHLIPDALEKSGQDANVVGVWVLVGIISFYFMETMLQSRLMDKQRHSSKPLAQATSYAKMNLVGDGVHNFVDGILIASSFLVDPAIGFATTIAIVLHEIPQEISDISILIQGGFSRKQAVFLNFLCALLCTAGAMATLLLSQLMELGLGSMLAFTAGGFIYIAVSDLVPLLRSKELNVTVPVQLIATLIGVVSMQSILWLENII